MSNSMHSPGNEPLTLEGLHREILHLRERVEDLEDLRDLEEAIVEHADKPLISWDQVSREILD